MDTVHKTVLNILKGAFDGHCFLYNRLPAQVSYAVYNYSIVKIELPSYLSGKIVLSRKNVQVAILRFTDEQTLKDRLNVVIGIIKESFVSIPCSDDPTVLPIVSNDKLKPYQAKLQELRNQLNGNGRLVLCMQTMNYADSLTERIYYTGPLLCKNYYMNVTLRLQDSGVIATVQSSDGGSTSQPIRRVDELMSVLKLCNHDIFAIYSEAFVLLRRSLSEHFDGHYIETHNSALKYGFAVYNGNMVWLNLSHGSSSGHIELVCLNAGPVSLQFGSIRELKTQIGVLIRLIKSNTEYNDPTVLPRVLNQGLIPYQEKLQEMRNDLNRQKRLLLCVQHHNSTDSLDESIFYTTLVDLREIRVRLSFADASMVKVECTYQNGNTNSVVIPSPDLLIPLIQTRADGIVIATHVPPTHNMGEWAALDRILTVMESQL